MWNKAEKSDFFLLIDKPLWLTSFDVIRQLKKYFQIKKIGHTGALDPLATGLLLVAFWNYTKLIPYFEKDRKSYEFQFSLEWTTASLDAEEELIPSPEDIFFEVKNNLTQEKILEIIGKHFNWEIEQIPPKYSALKIGGEKAVDLVRAGKTDDFEMKKRTATIHNIELLDFSFPKMILKATVSAGTYIRTIAWDFWDILGTWAYVTKLRRTEIWNLQLTQSYTLDTLESVKALSPEVLFPKHDFLDLSEEIITRLSHWQRVKNTDWINSWEYFLEKNWLITHVIEVDEYLLKMKRKIV
jgi:tRNA pseudouridine55 synthase